MHFGCPHVPLDPHFSSSVLSMQKGCQKGPRVVPGRLKPSPWGPLKVHNTSTRIRYEVPGHSTRCVQVWVQGAKCRCGVQVQGKRYRKSTSYKVHGTQKFRASFAGTAQYTPNAQARWRINNNNDNDNNNNNNRLNNYYR